MITKEDIPAYKEAIPEATDEQLVWLYKVCISKQTAKKDFEKLAELVQKERRKRGSITSISSKIVQPSLKKQEKGAASDMYEDEQWN